MKEHKLKGFTLRLLSLLMAITQTVSINTIHAGVLDNTPVVNVTANFDKEDKGFMDAKTAINTTGTKTKLNMRVTPQFQAGYTKGTTVHVHIPSFKIDDNGEAIQISPEDKPTPLGIRAEVVADDDWVILSDKTVDGGWLSLRYVGNITGGSNNGFTLLLSTYNDGTEGPYGTMPEGTIATLHSYVEYASYNDRDLTNWETPKKKDDYSIVNLISSNLKWETSFETYEKDSTLIPWDRYNYGSYIATVKNTSENAGSLVKGYRISLDIDSTLTSHNGVIPGDVNRWHYKDGEITRNENTHDNTDGLFVGVENSGGVIIYDITGWNNKGSVEDYIIENKLEAQPYTYSEGGMLMLDRTEGDNNEIIYPELDAQDGRVSEKRFLVKIPFAAQGFPDLPANHKTLMTTEVMYANDKYWTKSDAASRELVFGKDNIAINKKAQEGGAVFGEHGYFAIKELKNRGTVPIFDTFAHDELLQPKDFLLDKVVYELDNDYFVKNEIDIENTSDIFESWFNKENPLRYRAKLTKEEQEKILKETGEVVKTKWVDVNSYVYNYDEETEVHSFTFDLSKIKDSSLFDNALRFYFKEKIMPNESFPGRIIVNGKVVSSVKIKNAVETFYTVKRAINDPEEIDVEYEEKEVAGQKSEDLLDVILPDRVNIKHDMKTIYNNKEAKDLTMPYERELITQYAFQNSSVSASQKGSIKINLNNKQDENIVRGVDTQTLTINKNMLEVVKLDSIKLVGLDGETVIEYINKKLVNDLSVITIDESGNYNVDLSKAQIGSLQEIIINFDAFQAKTNMETFITMTHINTSKPGDSHRVNVSYDISETYPYTSNVKRSDNLNIKTGAGKTSASIKASHRAFKKHADKGSWNQSVSVYRGYPFSRYDYTLDVPYKAMGSFLVSMSRPNGVEHNHENQVEMTVAFPTEQFDLYYFKLDPVQKKFIDKIEIYREVEGKEVLWETVSGNLSENGTDEWVGNAFDTKGQMLDDPFMRVNTALNNLEHKELFETNKTTGNEDHAYYKQPFSNDSHPAMPVSKVVFTYQFNKGDKDLTENTDFYGSHSELIEFTGRFYTASEKAKKATSVSIEEKIGSNNIQEYTQSTSINTAVHNPAAKTTVGAHINTTRSSYVVEMGGIGVYRSAFVNKGNLVESVSTEVNEWNYYYGEQTGFHDELNFYFEFPKETPNKDKTYNYTPTFFELSDVSKEYLDSLTFTVGKKEIILNESELDFAKQVSIKYEGSVLKYELSEDGKLESIIVPKGQYPDSIKLTYKNVPGIGDTTTEYDGVEENTLGTLNQEDLIVGGIVNGNKSLVAKTSTSTKEKYQEKETDRIRHASASLVGKTLDLSASVKIERKNDSPLYDFGNDDITPNDSVYAINAQNIGEANIKDFKFTITPDAKFRMRTLRVPKELYDGDNFELSSVKVIHDGGFDGLFVKNFKSSFVEKDGFYELDIQSLFDEGKLKGTNYKSEFQPYTNLVNEFVKVELEISAKREDSYLVGPLLDGESDIKVVELLENIDDIIFAGNWVDRVAGEKEYTLMSKPTTVTRNINYYDHDVSVRLEVESGNTFVKDNKKVSSDWVRQRVYNRYANLNSQGWFISKDGKNVFTDEDDLSINHKNVIHGDKTQMLIEIKNNGKKATSANADGNFNVYNPVSVISVPKGIKVNDIKLVDENKLNDVGINDKQLATVSKENIVFNKLGNFKENIKLSDVLELETFMMQFEDTTLQHGESVFILLDLEIVNDFGELKDSQGMKSVFNIETRPAYIHSHESYKAHSSSNNDSVKSTTSTKNIESDQYSTSYSKVYTDTIEFFNPNKIKIESMFVKENVDKNIMKLIIKDMINESQHNNTHVNVLIDLDEKGLQGFTLTEKVTAPTPLANGHVMNAVNITYSVDGIEFVSFEEIKDLSKVRYVNVDYGILNAYDQNKMVKIPDIELTGIGHWRDNGESTKKDYQIDQSALITYTHIHDYEDASVFVAQSKTTHKVLKEMPNIELDIQAFDDANQAHEKYKANNDKAKHSYRPNDNFWYKISMENHAKKLELNGNVSYGTGPLAKPIIIDRIPEYVAADLLDYTVENNGKTLIDLEAAMKDNKFDMKWYRLNDIENLSLGEFQRDNIKMPTATVEIVEDFDVAGNQYFKLVDNLDGNGKLSATQPNDLKNNPASKIKFYTVKYEFDKEGFDSLGRGDRIELMYSVSARRDNLPTAKYLLEDGERPVYAPYFGWYGNNMPVADSKELVEEPMAMDSLLHEVGITGSLYGAQVKEEFLTSSKAHIPGQDESNGNYYDGSARVSVKHFSELKDNETDQFRTSKIQDVSDSWSLQLKERVKNVKSENKILWTQDNLTLDKAWLYGASELLPDVQNKTATYDNPSNFYEHDKNLSNYSIEYHGLNKYHYDDFTYAVEYLEEFTSRLHGINYGSHNLGGLEFIYVMPKGVKPVFDEQGNLMVKANIGNQEVASDKVTATLIQEPNNPQGILAPKKVMEANTTKNVCEDCFYSSDESVPYVLKIVVDSSLGKWFNRLEKDNRDYKMTVDVRSVVYDENAPVLNETESKWYDLVLVSPLENGKDELYYRIYNHEYGGFNRPNFPSVNSDRYYMHDHAMAEGMDVAKSYVSYAYNSTKNFKFEPYGQYIRGLNAKNNKMSQKDLKNNFGLTILDLNDLSTKYQEEGETVEKKYAVSGDQLMMRKPALRTMVQPKVDKNNAFYSIDAYTKELYETFDMDLHIDNIHYEANHTHQRSPHGYTNNRYSDAGRFSPQTTGGARGTLFDPIITVLLPKGIVPVSKDGIAYSEDGRNNNFELSYEVEKFNITTKTSSLIGDITNLFDYEVKFVDVDEFGNDLNRYQIQFTAKTPNNELDVLRIAYNESIVISPKVKVINAPNAMNVKGDLVRDYFNEFDETILFTSSKRSVFDPVIEDAYKASTTSSTNTTSRAGSYVSTNDRNRKDAAGSSSEIRLYGSDAVLTHPELFSNEDNIVLETRKDMDNTVYPKDLLVKNGQITEERSNGVYSKARIYYSTPNIQNTTKVKSLLDEKKDGSNVISVGPSDKLWYSINVANKPNNSYSSNTNVNEFKKALASADLHHAKIAINVWVPEYVSYNNEIKLQFKDEAGQLVSYSQKELENLGWSIVVDKDNTQFDETKDGFQLVRFIVTTPENEKGVKGSLASGDSFTLLFKAKLTSGKNDDIESKKDRDKPWKGDDLVANSYIELLETDGKFNDNYKEERLVDQNALSFTYNKEKIEFNENKDFNLNDKKDEIFAHDDVSIEIVKPQGVIRKNMVKPRELFSTGDIGDPYFTASDNIEYILSEVRNTGAAVPRLIIDDHLPTSEEGIFDKLLRKLSFGLLREDKTVVTNIMSVSTGKWELPTSFIEDWNQLEPELDIESKYKVYVYYSTTPDKGEEFDTSDSWVLLNEGGTHIYENKELKLPTNQEYNQIYRVRWEIKSDEPTEYLIPTGFRLDVDADPETEAKEEVSKVDPENKSVEIYPESVVNNAPMVRLKAQALKTASVYLYNTADLWTEYVYERYAHLDRSSTRAYLTPSRPVVDIIYKSKYFRYDAQSKEDNKFSWDDILLVNPNISPHMKYTASVIPADKDMWTEKENSRYSEDALIDPVVVFELPSNFTLDLGKLKLVDQKDIDESNPLHPEFRKDSQLSDATETNLWTWSIERKDANGNLSHLQIDPDINNGDVYIGPWDGLNQDIFRIHYRGTLYPGDKLNIEFIGKVNEYIPGQAKPTLQSKVNVLNNTGMMNPLNTELVKDRYLGYNIDKYDINNNGRINDRIVSAQSAFFEFAGYNDFPKRKVVYSELNPSGTYEPFFTAIPEGKDYTYVLTFGNPNPPSSKGYKSPIIYDILPHLNDTSITGRMVGEGKYQANPRNSQWFGWLKPDTIKLMEESKNGVKNVDNQFDVYVGPFKKENGTINKLDLHQIPSVDKRSDGEYYKHLNENKKAREDHLVKLDELLALKKSNFELYEELSKHVKVISAFYKNSNDMLAPETKVIMEYTMHAPIGTKALAVDNIATVEHDLVKDYLAWNSVAGWMDSPGYLPAESNIAGAYVARPKDRVYIGDYIWKDINQDGIQNEDSINGINGVKIELLTKEGFLSNIEGQAVKEIDLDGKKQWVLIDTDGNVILDEAFHQPIVAKEPYSFVSESDVNGNPGYYVLSNLKEGTYRLKYTFPKEYAHYGITTPKIHNDVNTELYTLGETLPSVPSMEKEKANTLIIYTDEFTLEAQKEHDYYTDFDLGVYETVQYGGKIFMEDGGKADGWFGNKNSSSQTASYDKGIKDYIVTLRTKDGNVAINQRGEEMVTTTDSNGDYLFSHLPIGKDFYITVTDSNGEISKKVPTTPYIHSNDPLENINDNDLFTVVDEKTDEIRVMSNTFTTTRPVDTKGNYLIDTKTGFYQDVKKVYGGFITLDAKATIGNFVFHDLNRNGVQDRHEPGIKGVEVRIERSMYIDGKWVLDDKFNNSSQSKTTTNENGFYYFNEMPTSTFIDGKEYINGYKLFIDKFPDGMVETKSYVRSGNLVPGVEYDDVDSNLEADGSLTKDYLILSEKDIHSETGYDTSIAKHDISIDAGFVDFDKSSFEGMVFEDKDRNSLFGKKDDKLEGIEVLLEVKVNDSWETVMLDANDNVAYPKSSNKIKPYKVVTDQEGQYKFEFLHIADHKTRKPFEYRAIVKDLIGNYEVVEYKASNNEKINNNFKWQESKETYTVVSDVHTLVESHPKSPNSKDEFNFFEGQPVENINLGLYIHENQVKIGDQLFIDKNRNGQKDLLESGLRNRKVDLYQRINKSNWKLVDSVETDSKGNYEFEVELADLDPKSKTYMMQYEYRVGFELSSIESISPYKVSGSNESNDSDFQNTKTLKGDVLDDIAGIETDIHYVLSREADIIETEVWHDEVERVNFNSSKNDLNIDGGVMINTNKAVLNVYVFEDQNRNSIIDPKEEALAQTLVRLYRKENNQWVVHKDLNGNSELRTRKDGTVQFEVEKTSIDKNDSMYLLPYEYRVDVVKEGNQLFSEFGNDVNVKLAQDNLGNNSFDELGFEYTTHNAISYNFNINETVSSKDGRKYVVLNDKVNEDSKTSGIKTYENKSVIAGFVFEDRNDNGQYDQGELLTGSVVKLYKLNHENNLWELYDTTKASKGYYEFEVEPTNMNKDHKDYLIKNRYKVVFEKETNQIAAAYKVANEEIDSDVKDMVSLKTQEVIDDISGIEINDSNLISREAKLYNTFKDGNDIEFVDIDTLKDDRYIAAGIKTFNKTSKISGTIFHDDNKDGSMDEENFVPNRKVSLYKNTNGTWNKVEETFSNEFGRYEFNVPYTSFDKNSKEYLVPYEYKVLFEKLGAEIYTEYKADNIDDHLNSKALKLYDLSNGEYIHSDELDGINHDVRHAVSDTFTLVPQNESGVAQFDEHYEVEDINAGIIEYKTTSIISGVVFEDKNDNSVMDEDDRIINRSLYLYEKVDGIYKKVNDVNGIHTVKTNEKGYYEFEVLVAEFNQDSEDYLKPKEYVVLSEKESMEQFAQYNVENDLAPIEVKSMFNAMYDYDTNDFVLDVVGIEQDINNAITDDYLFAQLYDWSDGTKRIDLTQTFDQENINLGIVKFSNKSKLGGYLFNDLNADGEKQDYELGVEGKEVVLYKSIDGVWVKQDEVRSDETGYYEFEVEVYDADSNSPSYLERYNYKVVVNKESDELFSEYKVIGVSEELDSDVRAMFDIETGLEAFEGVEGIKTSPNKGLSRDAKLIETKLNGKVDMRTIKDDLDIFAGLRGFRQDEIIAGIVFDDVNQNGVYELEDTIADIEIALYRYTPQDPLNPYDNNGKWENVYDLNGNSSVKTGKDGYYEFKVPVADFDESSESYLIPYRYKVVALRPSDKFTSPYKSVDDELIDVDFVDMIDLNDKSVLKDTEGIEKDIKHVVSREALLTHTVTWLDGSQRFMPEYTQSDKFIYLGLMSYENKFSIEGNIYHDVDTNKLLEDIDVLLDDVKVTLLKLDRTVGEFIEVETILTESGYYKFDVEAYVGDDNKEDYLMKNVYKLRLDIPEGYKFSEADEYFNVEFINRVLDDVLETEEFTMYEDDKDFDVWGIEILTGAQNRVDVDGALEQKEALIPPVIIEPEIEPELPEPVEETTTIGKEIIEGDVPEKEITTEKETVQTGDLHTQSNVALYIVVFSILVLMTIRKEEE